MGYVTATDLLLGELTARLPASISVEDYIAMTGEEIDGKLGFVYVVPIDLAALPNTQGVLLRSIHRKLASGRIIMAATVAHQESTTHQYALHLVREAEMELMAIANGDVALYAPRVDASGGAISYDPPEVADPQARIIRFRSRDEVSAVEQFERNFMSPHRDRLAEPWYPGDR